MRWKEEDTEEINEKRKGKKNEQERGKKEEINGKRKVKKNEMKNGRKR